MSSRTLYLISLSGVILALAGTAIAFGASEEYKRFGSYLSCSGLAMVITSAILKVVGWR